MRLFAVNINQKETCYLTHAPPYLFGAHCVDIAMRYVQIACTPNLMQKQHTNLIRFILVLFLPL
ncbi:hypothetical protein HK12_04845 [Acetobacter orientalis]|uniref:Uncharacterized protein n=1 Tax=Acetobacter orientalis TaxID=146474 RepID=A0A252A1W3_9PROT|nr:hypothetical protein HK12_04845 [Acetobacter orientalis]